MNRKQRLTPAQKLADLTTASLLAVSMKRYERSCAALRASTLLLHLSHIGIAHGRALLERHANKSGRPVSLEARLPQARGTVSRSGRQPVVLFAFCLLTSAATIYAEEAWVLWERSTGPRLHETSMRAVSAWNAREVCEQALTKKLGSDSDLHAKNTNSEVMIDRIAGQPRLWGQTKGHPELTTMTTYVCLPDAVDPRAPKK